MWVKKICGQLNVVEKFMNDGNECLVILQQVIVIKGVVNGLMIMILEDYICEYVGKLGFSDVE